jgi:hypothetical protein
MIRRHRISLVLALALGLAAFPALAGTKVLSDVPEYSWYHGCSPTSGGMLMGYWYNQGFTNLLPGVSDPMVQDTYVNAAISSPQHNAGDTWVGHSANSIADFMKTVSGGTYANNIPKGLKDWSASVGVSATASHNWVQLWGGAFTYDIYQSEINAWRPMLLNLESYTPRLGWVGHTVVAYGYKDDMFNIKIPTGLGTTENVTVPGFAVMDTWINGVGAGRQSDWIDWGGNIIYSYLDADGREWWPFLDMTQTNGWDYTDYWDWQVVDGVFYQPVPAPATLWLFAFGLAVLIIYRRKPAN